MAYPAAAAALRAKMTQTGPKRRRDPALQQGADVTVTDAIGCPELVGPADAIRSIEEARVHHAARQRSRLVVQEWG
jgi:hypothetical protein